MRLEGGVSLCLFPALDFFVVEERGFLLRVGIFFYCRNAGVLRFHFFYRWSLQTAKKA